MADLARIKGNVAKMAAQNAPEADIDGYIASEGVTLNEVRDFQPVTDASLAAETSANRQKFWGDGPKQTGLIENIGAGIDHGANTLLGAPVDLPVWVGNRLINATNAGLNLAGQGKPIPNIPTDLPGSSEKWEQTQERLGFTPPSDVVPADDGQRLARAAAEGVTMAAVPEMAVMKMGQVASKLPAALQAVPEVLGAIFGQSRNGVQFARSMATNAAAGAGGQAAADAAPEGWEPVAGLAGGLGAATLTHGVTALPALVGAGGKVAGEFFDPLTSGGQERIAGRALREGAESPGGVIEAIDTLPSELVPGSKPTTFQLTGDMGLGEMERGATAKNPAEFMERRADQNTARLDAAGQIQPTGAPEQVTQALRSHIEDIDTRTYEALQRATTKAQDSVNAVGRGTSPEASGENMRSAIEAARAAAKEQEQALWSAVDPDGTLALSPSNTRQAAKQIIEETPASARQPSGEEASIYGVVAQYGDTIPLRELSAMHSRIKDELRALRTNGLGESASYRRLAQLNSSVFGDLNEAVVAKVVHENEAVAAGVMKAEDTLEAVLQRQAEAFLADRRQAAAGENGGTSVGYGGSGRPSAAARVSRAAGQGEFRPASTPRDPRLSGDGLQANFDEDALGRLTEAREATQARVNRFDNPVLRPMRDRPSTQSPYNMQASSVPGRIFHAGAKSFDDIRTYRQAAGDAKALPALQAYAVDRLRTAALREDGTFDPGKFASWRRGHADALRAFPALDAKFQSAAKASETMAEVSAVRKIELDEAQKGAVGRLLGLEDPQDVTRTIGAIFSRQDRNNELMRIRAAIGGNKEAAEGLRKAIVDHIASKFVSNTEGATSGNSLMKADGFQTFIKENKGALKIAGFTDADIAVWDAIASDLRQANRSIASVKIPGGSNTTQDALQVGLKDAPTSMFVKVLAGAAASTGGALAGGPLGAFAGATVAGLTHVLRQNGIQKADDLIKDALLNPQRAKYLMLKVKPEGEKAIVQTVAQMFRRAAVQSLAQTSDQEKSPVAH